MKVVMREKDSILHRSLRSPWTQVVFFVVSMLLGIVAVHAQNSGLNSRKIAELEADFLDIDLHQLPGMYEVKLSSDSKSISDVNVFAIKNPSRLVVDIPGFSSKRSFKQSVQNPDISSIRTGVHSDKVRLVVDMRTNAVPQFQLQNSTSKLEQSIIFAFSEGSFEDKIPAVDTRPAKKSAKDSLRELAEKPAPSSVKTAPEVKQIAKAPAILTKPSGKTALASSSIPPIKNLSEAKQLREKVLAKEAMAKRTPVPEPAKLDKKEKKSLIDSVPGTATLAGVPFRTLVSSQKKALLVDIDKPARYTFERKTESYYELSLENTKLSSANLSLPQFPPADASGFEVIVSRQSGESVVVRIYSPPGVELTAFREDGKLWVKSN